MGRLIRFIAIVSSLVNFRGLSLSAPALKRCLIEYELPSVLSEGDLSRMDPVVKS
jgi:hypothetical protein